MLLFLQKAPRTTAVHGMKSLLVLRHLRNMATRMLILMQLMGPARSLESPKGLEVTVHDV